MLVAIYYKTNLTMRQVAPLFGIPPAALPRIVDRVGPHLALTPLHRRPGQVRC